jgi:hypothetical protein
MGNIEFRYYGISFTETGAGIRDILSEIEKGLLPKNKFIGALYINSYSSMKVL